MYRINFIFYFHDDGTEAKSDKVTEDAYDRYPFNVRLAYKLR